MVSPQKALLNVHHEAAGAFSFSTDESSVDTLTKRVLKRAENPISIWDGKPRLSLAGVQEKLGVTIKEGEYGFGERVLRVELLS